MFDRLLAEILQIAIAAGIQFGSIQVIDSVHSEENINPSKEKRYKDKEKGCIIQMQKGGVEGKYQATDQQGQDVDQEKYFFGYKGYISMNAKNNLITSLEVTSGEVYCGHHCCLFVDQYIAKNFHVVIFTADQGCDVGNNHYY